MDVLQLDPTNATHVRQFREIRLCALHTDPAAFDSTYERELAFSDAAWRGHLASFAGHPGAVLAVYTAATTGGSAAPGAGPNQVASPVGIVGVNLPEPTDAAIWGMWVAPESRRRGLAAELLHNAEAWAAKSGADTATLWVHRSNIEAQALYHSRGYKLVEPDDLPADVPDACCAEVCMRARLAST
ncbi:MAG: ribosomal protein S18 acetylase RimI-like enzyme [Minisyncoccia bacterium]|jgi:ribosomal protein S18 acetylase RimI-like enzyme|tara:strand:- start:598 stop:1155 length:558 start_codon:yes stop_codon:yes gene_type:complete